MMEKSKKIGPGPTEHAQRVLTKNVMAREIEMLKEKETEPQGRAMNGKILQGLQTCLKVVRSKNELEYESALSELADALDLNPLGTRCECGADLSFCSEEVTGCGNCDLQ